MEQLPLSLTPPACLQGKPKSPDFSYAEIPRFRVALVREPETSYGEAPTLGRPTEVAAFLWSIVHDADREQLGALFLDTRHRLIGYQIAYVGTLTHVAAEPRGIFSAALLCNAHGVILFHNHPSGDPTPSAEDRSFTKRMEGAGDLLGIRVIDHFILGERARWTTLQGEDLQ